MGNFVASFIVAIVILVTLQLCYNLATKQKFGLKGQFVTVLSGAEFIGTKEYVYLVSSNTGARYVARSRLKYSKGDSTRIKQCIDSGIWI